MATCWLIFWCLKPKVLLRRKTEGRLKKNVEIIMGRSSSSSSCLRTWRHKKERILLKLLTMIYDGCTNQSSQSLFLCPSSNHSHTLISHFLYPSSLCVSLSLELTHTHTHPLSHSPCVCIHFAQTIRICPLLFYPTLSLFNPHLISQSPVPVSSSLPPFLSPSFHK